MFVFLSIKCIGYKVVIENEILFDLLNGFFLLEIILWFFLLDIR